MARPILYVRSPPKTVAAITPALIPASLDIATSPRAMVDGSDLSKFWKTTGNWWTLPMRSFLYIMREVHSRSEARNRCKHVGMLTGDGMRKKTC